MKINKPFPGIKRFTPLLDRIGRTNGARIKQGLDSGELDSKEMSILGSRHKGYGEMLKAFKSNDGKLGPVERMKLHKYMALTSKMIYDFKHNEHQA